MPFRAYAGVLWFLLFLFCLRVLGQALVAFLDVAFLPPMAAWYSGLLAYPWLLLSQVVIILVFGKICLDLTCRRGYFAQPRQALGVFCLGFGIFYLAVMLARYAIRMSLYPGERWIGGSIPTFFHWVLAAFILVLGSFHWLRSQDTGKWVPSPLIFNWPYRLLYGLLVFAALIMTIWLGSRLAALPVPAAQFEDIGGDFEKVRFHT